MKLGIRWKQRFSNYHKAFNQLQEFVKKGQLSKLEEQGLIKAFEYIYELAWNTIKDFYESQGETGIQGSKDALRLAFKRGLITDGTKWMNMVQSRIETAHSYNEATAKKVISAILIDYYPLFIELEAKLKKL